MEPRRVSRHARRKTHLSARGAASARKAVGAVARVGAADAVQLVRDTPVNAPRNAKVGSEPRAIMRASRHHATHGFPRARRRRRWLAHIRDAWHCWVLASSWAWVAVASTAAAAMRSMPSALSRSPSLCRMRSRCPRWPAGARELPDGARG